MAPVPLIRTPANALTPEPKIIKVERTKLCIAKVNKRLGFKINESIGIASAALLSQAYDIA